VIADELLGNTTLETIDFWSPRAKKNCKADDFSADGLSGLMAIRATMERQVYITRFRVELIDEDEYFYWSGMCDSDLLDHGHNYKWVRNDNDGKEGEDAEANDKKDMNVQKFNVRKWKLNVEKYLQAKIDSFCRLNAAGWGRILDDETASCNDWVDLLAAVNNDLDALLCVLLRSPHMWSSKIRCH
jgi:hypothetical protein